MIEIVRENGTEICKREIPKNVRQMGEVRGNTKIYIEDYIITFIKQISVRDDKPKAFVLYGDRQVDGDITLLFVNGAILTECCDEMQGKTTVFKEEVWKDVNEKAGRFFKDMTVLGWAYLRYDLADFVETPVLNTHRQFFRKEQQIYMEYSVGERIENLYLFENDSMQLQSGYFVYYERNEAMQNYMITVKQDEPEEIKPEVDKATRKFRGIVEERKEEVHRKQTMGMLYGTSVAMLLIVTIIGVTMINNYEKMQNMEKVLYDISSQITDDEETTELALSESPTLEETAGENGMEEIETKEAETNAVETKAAEIKSAETNETEPEEIETNTETNEATEMEENNLEKSETDESAIAAEPVLAVGAGMSEIQVNDTTDTVGEDTLVQTQEEIAVPGIYCIEKGDTLAKISNKFYGNENMIDKICEINGIEDKDNIWYGDNIVLP